MENNTTKDLLIATYRLGFQDAVGILTSMYHHMEDEAIAQHIEEAFFKQDVPTEQIEQPEQPNAGS